MATTTAVLGFFLTVAVVGIGGDVINVAPGVSVEFTCTGPDGEFPPSWLLNGREAQTERDCYRSRLRRTGGLNAIASLVINGNHICSMFNICCRIFRESQFLYLHNTTLIVQGHLPSPENVLINKSLNSTTIEWKSPYSPLNSDTIHVDPHITHYTVYVANNFTGNITKENVTETQYTSNTRDDDLCPMYQVSAWNAGGEGELSEPEQDSIPQVPTVENITVELTAEPDGLHIHIEVDAVCPSRMPEFFLITLMTPDGGILNETIAPRQHQPRQTQADFTISLPQTVDLCSLRVSISAGNSAGMSAPSEAVEVVCSDGNTVDFTTFTTTTTTTTTITTATTTTIQSGSSGRNTTIIVVLVGLIVAIGGVCIAAATTVIVYCRRHKKDKLEKREIEMKPNQAYETVTRAQPKTAVHTKPCPAYEVVAHAHH